MWGGVGVGGGGGGREGGGGGRGGGGEGGGVGGGGGGRTEIQRKGDSVKPFLSVSGGRPLM